MRVLFIGDMVGDPGLRAVGEAFSRFRNSGQRFDFIIANVENAAGGFGVNKEAMKKLSELDFNCMTSGNHIWDRPDIYSILDDEQHLLRPANYPPGSPGFGWQVFKARTGDQLVVINLQGRIFMNDIDCPFQIVDRILNSLNNKHEIIIVDFHAEATSEKQAMGWYLDGRVSAVIGTHTHVQSAEARILPGGTGFITDVGMCGSYDSVIGMQVEDSLFRMLKGRPNRLRVANQNIKFAGVALEIDELKGKCLAIERILLDIKTKEHKQVQRF